MTDRSSLIASVAGISLITPPRLENLLRALEKIIDRDHARVIAGDMAELGVYKGGSAKLLAKSRPDKILHLFDTFNGLPHAEDPDRNPKGHDLSMGKFAYALSPVINLLADCPNVRFHPGTFPETTKRLPHQIRFSFVHIDCDLYQSAKDAIHYFWPRMTSGGVLYFDDYGCEFTGVTDAVTESFEEKFIVKQYEGPIQIGCFVQRP